MFDLMPADERHEDEPDSAAVEAMTFVLSLRALGMRDTAVLGAMERVPRELFAPRRFRDLSRSDVALPLACGQTMTAPSVVAAMLTALAVTPTCRVLEIGTGSGYVTALLARLGCGRVTTVERYATLAQEAVERFRVAGLPAESTVLHVGDGCAMTDDGARYDRILLNGTASELPAALLALLAPAGRLVGAISGEGAPRLALAERDAPSGEIRMRFEGALRLGALMPGVAAIL